METEVMERVSEPQLVPVVCNWCEGNGWVHAFVFGPGFNVVQTTCPGCEGMRYLGAVYGEVAI